jgi:large subunit ribosomal protein L28
VENTSKKTDEPHLLKKFLRVAKKALHFVAKSVRLLALLYQKEVQNMAKCDFCGKSVTFGIQVSHSHRRSNRTWKPNIKRVKAVINGSPKKVYACTRCLRSGKVTRAV